MNRRSAILKSLRSHVCPLGRRFAGSLLRQITSKLGRVDAMSTTVLGVTHVTILVERLVSVCAKPRTSSVAPRLRRSCSPWL